MNNPIPTSRWTIKRIALTLLGAAALLLLCLGIIFFVWRHRTNARVEAKLAAIRKAGYPITPAELDAWYPHVPEDENAASIYVQAFKKFPAEPTVLGKNVPLVGEPKMPPRTAPMPPEMQGVVAAYLATNQPALDLLHQAVARDNSRYPVNLNNFNALLTHLAPLKHSAQMLALEAALNADQGRTNEAFSSLMANFAAANSLQAEPLLISHLVRISCLAIATTSLERCVNRITFTDDQLARLQKVLEDSADPESAVRAMAGERAWGARIFLSLRDTLASGNSDLEISTAAVGVLRGSGLLARDFDFYLRAMESNVVSATQPMPAALNSTRNMDSSLDHELQHGYYIFSRMLLPALGNAAEKQARNLALLRTAEAALAVERFRLAHQNARPESLAELVPQYLAAPPVDPFDGQPLRYRPQAAGYVIYSVGPDRHDDGGQEKKYTANGTATGDPYDVTFTVER